MEELLCPICYEIMIHTYIFNCGHLICVDCNEDKLKCPHCRSSVIFKTPECSLINKIYQFLYPDEYKNHEREVLQNSNNPAFRLNTFDKIDNLNNIKLFSCCICDKISINTHVLTCGHLICQICYDSNENHKIKCNQCNKYIQYATKKCIVLNDFINARFPKEIEGRLSEKSTCTNTNEISDDLFIFWAIHCDECSITPIRGKRWYKDLEEEGDTYDVCNFCYNNNLSDDFKNELQTFDYNYEYMIKTIESKIFNYTPNEMKKILRRNYDIEIPQEYIDKYSEKMSLIYISDVHTLFNEI
jgi:hypothetical protein